MKHPFDYHSPSATQIAQISKLRTGCKALHGILLELPECPQRDEAVKKLEEVSMWGNKGIVMVDEGPVLSDGVSDPVLCWHCRKPVTETGTGWPTAEGWRPVHIECYHALCALHGAPEAPGSEAPWGPGYVQTLKPEEATHVYEPTIRVRELPCVYPRSMALRWLKKVG